jgi:predicted RNase H-like HicB family nuclease
MTYKIVLHQSEEGYSVWIPGLPGCCSQGETEAEAINNIKIAAQEYLSAVEDLIEGGEVREIEVAV